MTTSENLSSCITPFGFCSAEEQAARRRTFLPAFMIPQGAPACKRQLALVSLPAAASICATVYRPLLNHSCGVKGFLPSVTSAVA